MAPGLEEWYPVGLCEEVLGLLGQMEPTQAVSQPDGLGPGGSEGAEVPSLEQQWDVLAASWSLPAGVGASWAAVCSKKSFSPVQCH